MSRQDKLLQQILLGASDGNVRFADLCGLLEAMGFTQRVRGSHHIFRHPNVNERINLQAEEGRAKRYQVRQVRLVLIRNRMIAVPEREHG